MTKNTVRNLAVCCGAIWRRTEKPKCRCTTTIHRMYKSSNIVLENLLTVWHLVRTTLFVPIRFRLPIRNLIIAVAASWRNAKKSLNRCTSTFSAENYSSGIFFKSLSYPISIKISSFPDARSGAQTFSDDFLDFSKFWTAISWNLWRHLASKKNHHFWKKNLKTASKSAYKWQRNACSNYAPLRPRSVTKKWKHSNTTFSHLQLALVVRSPQTLHGDSARQGR